VCSFNNIGHAALEQAVGNFPARGLIKQWLKAGYVEAEMLHPPEAGVPQGGVISPWLLNVALHGMEQALGIAYTPKGVRRGTYALVRYADDLVIFSPTHDKVAEAQHLLSTWLRTRGLRLSDEKTHIRHLREGFNFLGFNIRLSSAKNNLLFSNIYQTVLMSPARVISPFFVITATGSWRMSRYTRAVATIMAS
jgi:RNA-directed DNA polymerase